MIPNTVEALISLEASNDVPVVLQGQQQNQGLLGIAGPCSWRQRTT